jgi:GNAT superfamily N-acetyltransferase
MYSEGVRLHHNYEPSRIATSLRWQGQGIGGQLLAAATRRCLRASAEVGGVVLIIDAKNDERSSFSYRIRQESGHFRQPTWWFPRT